MKNKILLVLTFYLICQGIAHAQSNRIEIIPRAGANATIPSITKPNQFNIETVSRGGWSLGAGFYIPISKHKWVAGLDMDINRKSFAMQIIQDGRPQESGAFRQIFISAMPSIGYKIHKYILINAGPYYEVPLSNDQFFDIVTKKWTTTIVEGKSEWGLGASMQINVKNINMKIGYMHALSNNNAINLFDLNGNPSSDVLKNYQQTLVFQLGYRLF